jgi:tetratricopeptide (TPR) repeat protein
MALSYYNINVSQEILGKALRPYQHPKGDNDDKSVTLEEMAKKAEEYGLIPFHRPVGDIELVKKFIASDMPVIARTLLKQDDDIGHYRVIKGYNEITKTFVQDDSLQGKNLSYSYDAFNKLWKTYNYEYLVLVPKEKLKQAENILGEDKDTAKAWEKAARKAEGELVEDQNDIYARLNLSVALYHSGNYSQSIAEFEKIESRLPFRTLWYQIEPILSYEAMGADEKVLTATQEILDKHNRAFSELYIMRGKIFKKQGKIDLARAEFEKAVFFNENLAEAREAFKSI